MSWRKISQRATELVPAIVPEGIKTVLARRTLTDDEANAYSAPFPGAEYQTGALLFPRLVPIRPDHPGSYDNRVAIEKLKTLDLPVLLLADDRDPYAKEGVKRLADIFKNAAPAITMEGAGHFIQEDAGEEVAEHIRKWMTAKA